MNTLSLYGSYKARMQKIADVRHAGALMQWDQETYLPKKAASIRGQQISTLSELAHQMFTDPAFEGELEALLSAEDLSPAQRRNVERTMEDYSKSKKYPSAFVRALADQTNKTFHAWMEARKHADFSLYVKDLEALLALKKEETSLLGYEGHPYNALLDEYEKGCTVALLDQTFGDLLPQLRTLFQRITAKPQADDRFLQQHFPRNEQWDWGLYLLKALHYDLDAGRQDISEHPFSISFAATDVRVTTRIDENDFGNMTWSCIHETGHALYEQGLPVEEYGLPLGEACSYSIHESQSRMWENNVGRSLPFWTHHYPTLVQRFPKQFVSVSLEQFYKGINKVQPSLIRTEADEISYHFHVYIRYELEKKLMEGSLQTADIPAYWNEAYSHWLGIAVPDDRRGALQDVHWSHGSFGYFPTYSLGSFYAAQLYATAGREIPGLETGMAAGDTLPLLQWLREKVHARGRYHNSEDLCREVTGEGLNARYFTDYLLQKYTSIYNL